MNIFLADDDVDDTELFGEAIKETHPDTTILNFSDGDKLLDYLKDNNICNPDIIFLDINMPIKNGKECLLEIRKTDKFKLTPVIIFSTSLDTKDIDDTFKGGANLFIAKPDSFRTQVDTFKRVFDLYWNNGLFTRTMASFVLQPSMRLGA